MAPRARGHERLLETWATYRRSIGDRSGLFAALRRGWAPSRALYPGCFLDLSPSTAIPSVTYVDVDRRAARYFADEQAVAADLRGRTLPGAGVEVRFVRADYTAALPLPLGAYDLLVSLYAGPFWESCRHHLAPGGLFLCNASHSEASLAALDPALRLIAVVHGRADDYRVVTDRLDRHLVPRRPADADPDLIRRRGRGIAYTASAFAYLFRAG